MKSKPLEPNRFHGVIAKPDYGYFYTSSQGTPYSITETVIPRVPFPLVLIVMATLTWKNSSSDVKFSCLNSHARLY